MCRLLQKANKERGGHIYHNLPPLGETKKGCGLRKILFIYKVSDVGTHPGFTVIMKEEVSVSV